MMLTSTFSRSKEKSCATIETVGVLPVIHADADDVAGIEVAEHVAADLLDHLRAGRKDRVGCPPGTSTRWMVAVKLVS